MTDDQIDYDDEGYGGSQKLQYHGSGAIPALAEDEIDDEYDDLYNDVNVGENFQLMHRSEPPTQPTGVGNGGFQSQKVHDSRVEASGSQNIPVFPEQKEVPLRGKGPEGGNVGYPEGSSAAHRGRVMDLSHGTQARNMGFQGPGPVIPNLGGDPSDMNRRIPNEPASLPNAVVSSARNAPQVPANQMSVNADVNRPIGNDNQIRPPIENGSTMLFVGELHWWTTDAELESVCSQYGRVKEIKFFDERASGKSKGYCQVEFYDATAAASCKDGMNGYAFNGRACVVAFASPQTLKQMGAAYTTNKTQNQPPSQNQGRRPTNDAGGRGGNMNYQGGDTGRNYGRGNWPRGGQGVVNKGPVGAGSMRGRGAMGAKNMMGNAGGVGMGANGGVYGQGLAGPAFGGPAGGMMPPQGMLGAGFDPTYMGRGAGYGGFGGPGFPGMMPSFPGINTMGLGVAPHVNPAFFGRGMAPNGMGMMGSSGMDVPNAGMWSDTSMGGWVEEHERRTRESSYGGDDGASEYGYGEINHEKGVRSTGASREKERGSERDFSGNSDRRHREEREQEWERPERDHREHRYREEKDSYREHRQRERDSGYDDDRDRGQSSSRSRSRSRAVPEDDHRSRSRDADYGKRRRLPSE